MPPAPIRTVIVDDVAEIRLLLSMTLPEYGDFEVVGQASNGREAVDQVRTLQPDLVLMDLSMPVMDGIAATSEIRAFDKGVTIAVLSGFQAEAMAQRAFMAGADDYHEKGLDMLDLAQRLAAHFECDSDSRTG